MNHGIPEDIRWLIEAKVRLSAVEQEFLTSSARQIIISAATAEQLID